MLIGYMISHSGSMNKERLGDKNTVQILPVDETIIRGRLAPVLSPMRIQNFFFEAEKLLCFRSNCIFRTTGKRD